MDESVYDGDGRWPTDFGFWISDFGFDSEIRLGSYDEVPERRKVYTGYEKDEESYKPQQCVKYPEHRTPTFKFPPGWIVSRSSGNGIFTNMKLNRLILMIVALASFVTGSAAQSRLVEQFEPAPTELLKTRPDTEIKDQRVTLPNEGLQFGDILYRLAFQTGVPIGVEVNDLGNDRFDYAFEPELVLWDRKDLGKCFALYKSGVVYLNAREDFRIDAANARFEDVLNELLSQMDGYKWEIVDGAVNIRPKTQKSSEVTGFLDTKIGKLTLPEGSTTKLLVNRLLEIPELRDFDFDALTGATIGDDKFTLKEKIVFENLTVRQLLNRLAKINMAGWYVGSESNGTKTRIIVDV